MSSRDTGQVPGVRLGKYTLLTRLAAGGMGEVYVAELAGAAGFSKRVVIKRLLPQLADNERFVAMFLDEARLTAQLSHPNICQVFEFDEVDGEYYLVMEYLEGVALSRVLQRRRRRGVAVRLAATIIAQACEGLAHAHGFRDPEYGVDGIVHRDVSPQNLFLTTAGMVKLLDFGIAKVYREGSLTVTGSAKGKYRYMSPEQIKNQPMDPRSDLFALGVVLFETLTGQPLYKRETEYQTFQAIIEGQRPRLTQMRPDVPAALDDVVECALQVDRTRRFASARGFAESLGHAVAPLGGLMSMGDLAGFVTSEHAQELTEQRSRIKRVTAELRVVGTDPGSDWTPSAAGQDPGPGPLAGGARGPAGEATPSAANTSAPESIARASVGPTTDPSLAAGERPGRPFAAQSVVSLPQDISLRGKKRTGLWVSLAVVAVLVVGGWYGLRTAGLQGAADPPPPRVAASVSPAAQATPSQDSPEPQLDLPSPGDESTVNTAADPDSASESESESASDPDSAADPESDPESGPDPDSESASDPDSAADPKAGPESASTLARKHTRKKSRKRRPRADRSGAGSSSSDAEQAPGYFTVDATPYAEIFIDRRKIGLTPLARVPLAPGKHRIRAVSASGDVKRLTVRITSGDTVIRRIKFTGGAR